MIPALLDAGKGNRFDTPETTTLPTVGGRWEDTPATSIAAITVYPSGFALQGGNFTTHVSDNPTTLTIVPAALDPMFLNIYAVQELIPNLLLAAAGTLQLKVESGTGVGNSA
jgi:hypothetical protein